MLRTEFTSIFNLVLGQARLVDEIHDLGVVLVLPNIPWVAHDVLPRPLRTSADSVLHGLCHFGVGERLAQRSGI